MEEVKTKEQKRLAILIGRRIAYLRNRIGMNQEALAYELGLGQSMISQAENGKKFMALDKLHLAAKVFGVPVSALLSDVDMTNEELEAFYNLGRLVKRKASRHRIAVFSHLSAAAKDTPSE